MERAAVLFFWLVGQIDPELDTMQVGMPYVLPLVMARPRLADLTPSAPQLPDVADLVER